jgi:hypothetical protein
MPAAIVEPAVKAAPPPRPLAKRAWVWVTVGAVVVAAGAGIALGVVYGSKTVDPPTPPWGVVKFGATQ